MNRRFGLLYVVFSLLVLAVLVVLFVVRVNTIREFNIQDAQTSFIRLQGRIRDALKSGDRGEDGGDPGEDAGDPGPVIREYVELVPTAQAIVLYDPDEGFRYVWTSNVDILAFSRTDLSELRGFPSYDFREVSQIKTSAPLEVDGSSRLYLDGIYRVLSSADTYVPLRDSLIALLAFAFLTVLIAIGLNISQRPRPAFLTPSNQFRDPPAPEGTEVESSIGAIHPAPAHISHALSDTAVQPAELPDPVPAAPIEPILEEVDIEEIATDPGEPGTLINPVTNLSYAEHLERRLGLELERAAYNDQDLTCVLVRFGDAAAGGEAYSLRAGQILAAFKFEDLCFEHGSDAFCVILPNTELSQGIREAEAFKGDHKGKIYSGLSARNGRLVEASRVLGEAERSLEHAQHEPGGIVGFRPDPRKYRQFVTQQLGTSQ